MASLFPKTMLTVLIGLYLIVCVASVTVETCDNAYITNPVTTMSPVSVSPYYLPMPGYIYIRGSFTVEKPLQGLDLQLTINKLIPSYDGVVTIPCIEGSGRCMYDFCDFIETNQAGSLLCRDILGPSGFPCNCAEAQMKTYHMGYSVKIQDYATMFNLPWLVVGETEVIGQVFRRDTHEEVFCVRTSAAVVSNVRIPWQ